MKKIVYGLIICFLTVGCNQKTNDKKIAFSKNYDFEVIDTLKVPIVSGSETRPIDYNAKTDMFLFGNLGFVDTIYHVSTTGEVKNRFYFKGGDEREIGNVIHNVGFYRDTCLLVNSERGFYFYDLKGDFLKKIEEITPIKGTGGIDVRLRELSIGDDEIVALQLKNSLPAYSERTFAKHVLNSYKYLTFYNIDKQEFEFKFGYEEGSLFQQESLHFGNPWSLFDYDYDKQNFFVIHSPDPQVYVYNYADGFESPIKTIDLEPSEFNLPITYGVNQLSDGIDHLVLNGQYTGINIAKSNVLVTYSSGLPEDDYYKLSSDADLPALYAEKMKFYCILLDEDGRISNDIELPYGANGIGLFRSNDYLLLNTNPNITELSDGIVFYVARLKESLN